MRYIRMVYPFDLRNRILALKLTSVLGRSRRGHGQFLQYPVSEDVYGTQQSVQLRQQVSGMRGRAHEGDATIRRRAAEIGRAD